MPGRRPSAAKRLAGTFRADRSNPREPRPPLGTSRARQTLAQVAKVEHRRLVAALAHLRVTTLADGLALELTALALAEYRMAVDTLLQAGQSYTCTTEAGATMHRARPEVSIASDSWRRALRGLEAFGLSPASRARVETLSEPLRDPIEAFRRSHPNDELHRRRALRNREVPST